jgi:hypothetical protein
LIVAIEEDHIPAHSGRAMKTIPRLPDTHQLPSGARQFRVGRAPDDTNLEEAETAVIPVARHE